MKLPHFAATLGCVISSPCLFAEIPHPELLPTTQAIHDAIAKTPDPEPAAMKAYAESVKLAKDSPLELMPISGGEFLLGSPDTETNRKPNEGPQCKLKIEPFWMGKLEISWDLYRPFMENGKPRNKDGTLNRDSNLTTSEPPEAKNGETLNDTITQPTPPYVPMHFQMGDGYSKDYPAVGMTQHAANKFCEWLSEQTGHFYRLPTEAEWEYACRANTITAYSFGDDPAKLGDYAWFSGNSEFQYQKVGTRKANPWGLHDMHGNVAEHVLDQYAADSYSKLKNGMTNPWTPPVNRYPTVVRGGHWDADPADLRSASRLGSSKAWKIQDPQIPKSLWYFTDAPWLGFRIVRPLKTPPAEEMHRFWNTGPGASE
ncbi:MAG: formylglycine-generating enzyme family protein [Verrucomicrobiota bacterium]